MQEISDKKLTSLIEIIKEINSSHELQETLKLIMREAKNIMRAEASSLMLIDQETRELCFNITTGEAQDILKQIRIPSGKGFAGAVAASGESLIINDVSNDKRFYQEVDARTNFTTRNLICVPLVVKGRIIGVLQALNKIDSPHFTEEDLAIFTAFSDVAAIAIHNRELFLDMQRKAHEASALYRLSETINFCDTYDDLIRENVAIVSEVMQAKRVSVILKDEGEFKLLYRIGFPERTSLDRIISGNILEHMVRTNAGVFSPHIGQDIRFVPSGKSRYGDKSFVAAPLKMKNQIVAFICVTERHGRQPFDFSDLRTLEMMAQQIMENYNHFRLSEEYRKKQVIEAELSIAARLQQDILPGKFKCRDKLDIAAMTVPAKMVGGDFYDYIPLGGGKYGLIIADVSGKGISAGLFMAMSRSFIRANFTAERTPSQMMETVNKQICGDSRAGMFVTCFCCVIDVRKQELAFSNAGHLKQYLVNRKTGDVRLLTTRGRPMGIFDDSRYEDGAVKYNDGDLLLLFTDGVTEATNSRFDEYGERRLRRSIAGAGAVRSGRILEKILDDVAAFRGGAEQADDITLMAVGFNSGHGKKTGA